MESNVPETAMSTALFKLLAANPVHEDCFCATPFDRGALGKSCQWHCSLPLLELEDVRAMQSSHVGSLLYEVILVVEPQSSLP